MQIEHSNEIDLIRQTLAGDTSAFDLLVKTHRRTIYVLVLSYINNPADAEDLTQRIFIRAYERLSTLRQLEGFLPWLQQIAHNACKDWLRSQSDLTRNFGAVNDADFTETAPSPEELALKREVESVVREAIGALKETDRKLMEARYIEGASYAELQVESGLSYAAIANRLKRAKQQLRRRIEKLLGGMIILPGRTLIRGGIELVKISAKTKLAAVGIMAVIGVGGGVLYHQTFETNPVVVSGQKGLRTETITEDTSSDSSINPHSSDNFSQNESISTAEIDKAVAWLKSLDDEKSTDTEKSMDTEKPIDDEILTSDFNDEPENTNSESGLTPEQQKKVDSITQQISDGTDEYRGLLEILRADPPVFAERWEQARHRMYELDDELARLLSDYYFITRDMDELEQFLPLFEGLMKIEFLPPTEGEILRMDITLLIWGD